MTELQLAIHKGLRSIGDEIATFYTDALTIIESNLGSKPYLLAHLAREIECGLRDVLVPSIPKKTDEDEIKTTHRKSILDALGLGDENDFAKEWYKVAENFHKNAHRHGAWKSPRDKESFSPLWERFEKILYKLVGSYYAFNDRLDHILNISSPTKQVLNTLPNIFKNNALRYYFFSNLKFIEWFPRLKDFGYFTAENQPKLVELEDKPGSYSVPVWPELTYLEWVADQLIINVDIPKIRILAKIINEIINYRDKNDDRIDNYRTDSRIINLISKLPKEYIDFNHFHFIEACLKGKWGNILSFEFGDFVDELVLKNDKDLLLKSINVLFTYKTTEDDIKSLHSILDYNGLKSILDRNSQKVIEVLGTELVIFCISKIKELNATDTYAFNSFKIPTIENHSQTRSPDHYCNQLIYLTRDALEDLDVDEVRPILVKFLNEKESIFKRLAIHLIKARYSDFKELFWNIQFNPLEESNLKHEVYELFKDYSEKFSDDEVHKCIHWIENKNYGFCENIKDDIIVNKRIAYAKREWLSALLMSDNVQIIALNDKYKEINEIEIRNPGFNSWFEMRSGNLSPLTVEELQEKSLQEVINIYKELDTIEKSFDGPTKEGLLDSFIETVRMNPERYIVESEEALNYASISIVNALICGLSKAWKDDKKFFTTIPVFTFIKQIIDQKEFWSSEKQKVYYHKSFLQNLLYFIESGISDDKHSFEEDVLPTLKLILINIEKNYNYETIDNYDLVSASSINDPKGIVYIVLFQLSLKLGRLQKEDVIIWDKEIEKIITDKLNSNKEYPLFYCVLGQFYSNIYWLNKKWAENNFDKVFSLKNDIIWEAAITGYFYRHSSIGIEPNLEFLKNGHYLKALKHDSLSNEVKKKITQIISINFLNGVIEIDNILIKELINSSDEVVIRSLVSFYNKKDIILENEMLPRFRLFWKKIFSKASLMGNKQLDVIILSGSFRWLSYFNEIDDDLYGILLNSSSYIHQFDKFEGISLLLNYVDDYPEKVGGILLKMFEKEVLYDISRGKIVEIVEKLYSKNQNEIADKICNLHGENGIDILRETYKKYNS